MLPPGLQTTREVTLYHNSIYNHLIDSGQAIPFIYPWAGLGAFAVIGYLLIDHRQHKWTRHVVYALLVAFQVQCILTTRAQHPAAAFGVGLLSAWGLLWVFALMVARDCQTDYARLERRAEEDREVNGHANGSVSKRSTSKRQEEKTGSATLYWQSYPSSLLDRIDWIADVFCSFRGIGWNFQVSGVPRLPQQIETQLDTNVEKPEKDEAMTVSKSGIRRIANTDLLFRKTITFLILGYFVLDVIITLMHNDRYFIGYMDAAPPAYLPTIVQQSPILIKSYRLVLSLLGIYFALREIFTLGPLFFTYILGPAYLGIRGEPWMNPIDMFGSYSSVLDYGIAGWWGGWWHQVFRYGFQAPTERLLEILDVEKKSQAGKLISLFAAFFLSGCLHACGSYTQLGPTRPLAGPFTFFMLQPLGIMAQMAGSFALKKAGVADVLPKPVKQAANFVIVHFWLFHTAPFLMDDFASGGVWLFEPLAFSPLRGLGYGAKDDGFFCWWNGIVFWRSGKHWWDTGLAL